MYSPALRVRAQSDRGLIESNFDTMARIRHLSRAPIAEAVIDLRVQPTDGVSAESFSTISELLKDSYPILQRVESLETTFGIQEGQSQPPQLTYSEIGILLKSRDQRNVAQFRTNGFTFNRLPPYTSWEEVFPEAIELWERYRGLATPARVTRIAVRYINRLPFALPVDLSEYLTASPSIPDSLPQVLRAYLTRLVLSDAETANSVIVTQAPEPSADADHVVVLLDVDAYRDVDMDPGDPRIKEILGSLRELKNRVFFGSITERTAEMHE